MEKRSIDLLELLSKLVKEQERDELLKLIYKMEAEKNSPPRIEETSSFYVEEISSSHAKNE